MRVTCLSQTVVCLQGLHVGSWLEYFERNSLQCGRGNVKKIFIYKLWSRMEAIESE